MANNSKKEVEDILAEVDKTQNSVEKSRKSSQKAQQISAEKNEAASTQNHNLPFVIVGGIVIVVLIGLAGYIFLMNKNSNIVGKIAKTNTRVGNLNAANSVNVNKASDSNVNVAPVNASRQLSNDTDGDGLTNQEEAKYGTDPKNPDTDGDGLSDREEVKAWKTNPLKADTDGDGVNDGQEIKNLTNPLGSGKLFDLQKAIQQLNVNK